jgi:hypothetical protein
LAGIAGGFLRLSSLLAKRGPGQPQDIFERKDECRPGERLQKATTGEGQNRNLHGPAAVFRDWTPKGRVYPVKCGQCSLDVFDNALVLDRLDHV